MLLLLLMIFVLLLHLMIFLLLLTAMTTIATMTLLVLKSGEHRADELEVALARFADAGVTVQGAVLNQVGVRAGAYGQTLKAAYA